MDLFDDHDLIIILLEFINDIKTYMQFRQLSKESRKKVIEIQTNYHEPSFEIGYNLNLLYNLNIKKVNLPYCPSDYRYIAPFWNKVMYSINITNSLINDISGLVNCKHLNLSGCVAVTDFTPLNDKIFETLNLSKTRINDLSKITIINELDISYCVFIDDFTFLDDVDLDKLNLQYTYFRRRKSDFTHNIIKTCTKIGHIKKLYIESSHDNMSPMITIPVRRYDTLSFSPSLELDNNLTDIENFFRLIHLKNNDKFKMEIIDLIQLDIDTNEKIIVDNLIFPNILGRRLDKYLKFTNQKKFDTFDISNSPIYNLNIFSKDKYYISKLVLNGCYNLANMDFLNGMSFIYLDISDTPISNLNNFDVSETLILRNCSGIRDFKHIYDKKFKLLDLTNTKIKISDIQYFKGETVIITGCRYLNFKNIDCRIEKKDIFEDENEIVYL